MHVKYHDNDKTEIVMKLWGKECLF